MKTFEQELNEYIEHKAAKFSDHPDLIGCNDALNGYLCFKRGAELLIPMLVEFNKVLENIRKSQESMRETLKQIQSKIRENEQ